MNGAHAVDHDGYSGRLGRWVFAAVAACAVAWGATGLALAGSTVIGYPLDIPDLHFNGPAALPSYAGSDSAADVAPSITTDGNGVWVAAWQSAHPLVVSAKPYVSLGTDYDILVSRSTDNGTTWSAPKALNTNAATDSGSDVEPQVVAGASGQWLCVWASSEALPYGKGSLGTDYDILVSRSTDGGVTWTSPAPLNSRAAVDGTAWDGNPRVATDGTGRWLAVWSSADAGTGYGSDYDVLYATSTNNGASWSSSFAAGSRAAVDTGSDVWPDVATDRLGAWVVVWESSDAWNGTVGTDYDIRARPLAWSGGGLAWSNEVSVNQATTDGGNDHRVKLAVRPQHQELVQVGPTLWIMQTIASRWVAVWHSYDTLGGTVGNDADILTAYASGSGASWSTPAAVNSLAATDAGVDGYPQIATDQKGHWTVLWHSSVPVAGMGWCIVGGIAQPCPVDVGTDYDILGARSSDRGVTWTDEKAIHGNALNDSGSDNRPSVASDGRGTWLAAWHSNESLGGTVGTDYDILFGAAVPPRVVASDPATGAYAGANPVPFTVTFTRSVSGADTGDFQVSGLSGATIQSVTGAGATRTVTVDVGTNTSGTFRVNVNDDDTIQGGGNPLGGLGAGNGTFTSGGTVTLDFSAPAVGTVTSPVGSSTSDDTRLPFTWSGFSDPVSGVVRFEVAFGTPSAPQDFLAFSSVGTATSRTFTPAQFSSRFPGGVFPGGDYRCSVRAVNGAGLVSGVAHFDIHEEDTTPPTVGTVVSAVGPYTLDTDHLTFSWSGFADPQTTFTYQVAFGTPTDGTVYQGYTSVGSATSWTFHPADFPAAFPGGAFTDGPYQVTVRAVNVDGHASTGVTTTVTVDTSALPLSGDIPIPPRTDGTPRTWSDVDWPNTVASLGGDTHAIYLGYAQKFITGDWGAFTLTWHFTDGTTLARPYNVSTDLPGGREPRVIFRTHVDDGNGLASTQLTGAPLVDVAHWVPDVTIHENSSVQSTMGGPEALWQDPDGKLRAMAGGGARPVAEGPHLVVLSYAWVAGPVTPVDFLGFEVVEVRPASYDPVPVDTWVGARLQPRTPKPDQVAPLVLGGLGSPAYLYQHAVLGAPQQGDVWATRPNTVPANMVVIWRRAGVADVEWPFEWLRYTAHWPVAEPAHYQVFATGGVGDPGPGVVVPSTLNAALMAEQFDAPGHHAHLAAEFTADGPGWALLRYLKGPSGQPGLDWVGFEVVRAVARDDGTLFDLTPVAAPIGHEIIDPAHEGAGVAERGYLHLSAGDRYDPTVYDDSGQIFPVNEGTLEVWWKNRDRVLPPGASESLLWPSVVRRYDAAWASTPVDGSIDIASGQGTGPLAAGVYGADWTVYVQNDPALPGYGPNDEHAFRAADVAYALRDDLTATPRVLIRHRVQPDAVLWGFKVYDVVRGALSYSAVVGGLVQGPHPLGTLPWCAETAPAPGSGSHLFRDRKGSLWFLDAAPATAVRYYYPIQPGFDVPGGTPAVGTCVPWLDGGTSAPADVAYQVSWPSQAASLHYGQTAISRVVGPTADLSVPIDGQCSVQVAYQQTASLVKLIDPVRQRRVPLASLPADVEFSRLSPSLQKQVSYDATAGELVFSGVIEATPVEHALLNVLTAQGCAELQALSADPAWRAAVDPPSGLCGAAASPVEILAPGDPFDRLAVTSGVGAGTGYVVVALGNDEAACGVGAPVDVRVFQVTDLLEPGAVAIDEPPCGFDEQLSVRHTGDLGGQTDQVTYQWRYTPDLDGTPPITDPATWQAPPGGDASLVTISGPGVLTLTDNWFTVRYQHPDGRWSDWAPPNLAPGWIKRAVGAADPFRQGQPPSYAGRGGVLDAAEAAADGYGSAGVNTIVSMISLAGPPYLGAAPLGCGDVSQSGLLPIYGTVAARGAKLSIDAAPPVADYEPVNKALLQVASREAGLYMLLGNEAYADASDPTIAFGTDGVYGAEASSVHCFANVTGSLLEEELALLRGRDDARMPSVRSAPFFNRLLWNFTGGLGEVAYALNYDIQDASGNADGQITEADARKLYPQGHGDAWGHYLSATKAYYRLLTHPAYRWVPRAEGVLVAGQPVTVDYYDERKFAAAAAAKARAGAEIVNLTYRDSYQESPRTPWGSYRDPDPARAWGMADWASRAGQGAYIDWVVGNALLPADDAVHTGVQKIDRTTVLELRDIPSQYLEIQTQLDAADAGLNPLGLATNVVPFDIAPIDLANQKTHFEQVYDRAVKAVNNAVTVFNHANNSTQLLRRQADAVTEFQTAVTDREADFNNRLIELFGYPYPDDVGPGKTYPTGYDGPDLYHYAYVDPVELVGAPPSAVTTWSQDLATLEIQPDGAVTRLVRTVQFHLDSGLDQLGLVKPASWTGGPRPAPGEIQLARSDLIQARLRFERGLDGYDALLDRIDGQLGLLEAQYDLHASEISIQQNQIGYTEAMDRRIVQSRRTQIDMRRLSRAAVFTANAVAEALPTAVGLSNDVAAPGRAAIMLAGSVVSEMLSMAADDASIQELRLQQEQALAQAESQLQLTTLRSGFAMEQQLQQLADLVRQEVGARLDLRSLQAALDQSEGRYRAVLARGVRLLEDRARFRRNTAAEVQSRRYRDMAFRVFRNDALQKYRAQFDMAARYVYLAAKAYDYETTFLAADPQAGQTLLSDLVRARLIGTIQNGTPLTGQGLADVMARLSQNFQVLKGQLGFNNPQQETNRFSLRSEFFRILGETLGPMESRRRWRETLRAHVVDNILAVPEFQRYARAFDPHLPVEPGIVIPFDTTVNFGENFFGWPLGGGDNAYDSSNFTTKIRSVGVWFSNYNNLASGLSNTPRVYLFPVGTDIQRSPTGRAGVLRTFRILDQRLPEPFPIGASQMGDPGYIPMVDSLIGGGSYATPRRYASFRAYHDSGAFNPNETQRWDSRLIGRSVWNTRWVLIIPAGTLLSDRQEALDRFIDGSLFGGVRDGNGVTDIKLFFETYAYPGN